MVQAGISSKTAGKLENRVKYNGKELQSREFSDGGGLEWTDYGARMYDAQIGRFFVHDKYAGKYDMLSPYNYVANNPISNIDINGDDIYVVGGTPAAKDKFVSQVSRSLGELYTVNINSETGKLNFVRNNQEGKLNKEQSAFLSSLESEPETDIAYRLVESSTEVLGDDFDNSSIDVDDMEQFDNCKNCQTVSTGSMLSHSFEEQRARNRLRNSKDYNDAHNQDGFGAEEKVKGWKRDPDNSINDKTKLVDPEDKTKGVNGSIFITYQKDGKKRTVVISLEASNIKKVEEY